MTGLHREVAGGAGGGVLSSTTPGYALTPTVKTISSPALNGVQRSHMYAQGGENGIDAAAVPYTTLSRDSEGVGDDAEYRPLDAGTAVEYHLPAGVRDLAEYTALEGNAATTIDAEHVYETASVLPPSVSNKNVVGPASPPLERPRAYTGWTSAPADGSEDARPTTITDVASNGPAYSAIL